MRPLYLATRPGGLPILYNPGASGNDRRGPSLAARHCIPPYRCIIPCYCTGIGESPSASPRGPPLDGVNFTVEFSGYCLKI